MFELTYARAILRTCSKADLPPAALALAALPALLLSACLASGKGAPARAPESYVDAGLVEPCATCGAEQNCTDVIEISSASHVSVDIVADPPPAGGDHNPCWANYGVYDEPLAGQYWLHNLEHGAVVYLYNCPDGCADDVSALATLVDAKARALLTSYPYMTNRFAALSWGRRLLSDCLDLQAMKQFYNQHVDRAPESIADGAPEGCSALQ